MPLIGMLLRNPERTFHAGTLFGDQTMRSRPGYLAFAKVTFRSEAQDEEHRLATKSETVAAIALALAESNLEDDPSDEGSWDCEIELLDEYCDDVDAQVPNVAIPTKH
jgi:hypothetical protein